MSHHMVRWEHTSYIEDVEPERVGGRIDVPVLPRGDGTGVSPSPGTPHSHGCAMDNATWAVAWRSGEVTTLVGLTCESVVADEHENTRKIASNETVTSEKERGTDRTAECRGSLPYLRLST